MTNPAQQHQSSSIPVPGSAAPVSPPDLQFPVPSAADRVEKAEERLERLQKVVTALGKAVTMEQVADAIMADGMANLGTNVGTMVLLSEDGRQFHTVRAVGYPPETMQAWAEFPADSPIPVSDACKTGEPVFLETYEERIRRYPALSAIVQDGWVEASRVVLPLLDERPLGAIDLRWQEEHRFDVEERAFMQTLAQVCAQAITRARLYDGARQEAEKRKQAEEHLSLLESAVRQSSDAILITTAQLDLPGPQIVFVNPAFTRITQYTAEEALGKTPRLLQGPRTERKVLDRMREDLNRGQSFFGETYNYRKDGGEFVMEWEVAAVRNKQEVVMHYIATQRDVTERRRDQERLRKQFEQMTALRAIDVSIMNHWQLPLTLHLILGQIRVLLGVDAVAILRLNRLSKHLEYAAREGFDDPTLFLDSVSLGEKPAGRAAAERQMLTIEDIQNEPSFLQTGSLAKEGFQDYYAVPITAKEQVLGVLELFHRTPLKADVEWLRFLEAITGQTAIAIENATLFSDLEQANSELTRSYDAAIEGWSRALDLRDKETEGHSERVTEMTMQLAERMGLPDEELIHVRRGALLHDIGKMGVPDTILLKPGPLTDEEWVVMRKHPEHAYEMLYPMTFLRPALEIPIAHHEKWDGTGYPHGLKGKQIPLAARIFAVADVWDALRSDRPYRKGWPVERVREHIRSLAGTHFDAHVVEAFLRLTAEPT